MKSNICQSPFLNSTVSILISYKIFQCICCLVFCILILLFPWLKLILHLLRLLPVIILTFSFCQSDTWLYYYRRSPLLVSMIINMFMVTDFQTSQGWHLSVEVGLVSVVGKSWQIWKFKIKLSHFSEQYSLPTSKILYIHM